ncbi:metal ABC transporter solute-binding protein, Zn/Mn family [Nocardia stercoris]|uniref:ABC transporter permease n=1 Tax=Nocardia stercoris TaxID=2483361 RepID=A0A3M2KVL8_9NOCA|nr:zinc ABC transporter substrate-binding protein [Nocardia stercoris]RMI29241.1 ABC transporter permease [Nocardia stercoris]
MRTRRASRSLAVVLGVAVAATVGACGSPHDSGKPVIVASTSVWGSVATAVAGPDMRVESIITSPTDDPHSYTATPADAAHIHDAALVIFNGGRYDQFAEQAAGHRDKPSIDAFDLRADKNDDNEHIWYDPATVGAVAAEIATDLGRIDSAHAQAYTDRANDFRAKLNEISSVTAAIAAAHPKSPVLQTEPIGHYLLKAADADDRTPHAFEESIEQGTDPAPADVATVRNMLTTKQVRALVYNVQTEDKTTKDIAAVAKSAGVAVVEVAETLPQGLDYLQWQTDNAQALAKALN